MKNIIAAIQKEHRSQLDKFNKLPAYERVSYIILIVLAVVFVVGERAYELGEYIGLKIGSMIV